MYKQQITAQKIDVFCGKGQPGLYRDFAMHAAVLWVFNADLLYQMRANFRQDEQSKPMPVPQEAVADLLLSSLVESLGQGWFEFDPAARELLLAEITHSPRFGKTRLDDLSDFLLQYLDRRPNAKGLENGVFAEMLHWNALMHVRPQEAAERIGMALHEGSVQKNAYQPIRIQQIYEKIMLPVQRQPRFKNLELYINGAAQLALERRGAAAKSFEQVDTAEMQFGKITLKVPKLKPIKTKFELPSGILHAAMSVDGKWIAAGMYNGSVALVNLISGEITYKQVSNRDVNSVRLKDNKLLVACLDGQVYVFDWTKEGWEQLFYHKFEEAVWTAEFEEEGDRFLLGMASGNVEMWRLSWRDLERRIYAHKKDVMEAQFAQISNSSISVSLDGSLSLNDLDNGKQFAYLIGSNSSWTLSIPPDKKTIAIGKNNGVIELIDVSMPGNKGRTFGDYARDIDAMSLSRVRLKQIQQISAHTQSVRSIAWLPYKDQFMLLSSSTDGGILVHSTEGELLHTIQSPGGEQAMCVQIVDDKIMTASGATLNIIPVQSVIAAIEQAQKQEAPKQEKDTVTYSEIILYIVSNVNDNTGETNFGLLKDLFNDSLNSVKIEEDVYDLDIAGMTLRVRLWEVLPAEIRKGLHRIYMSSGSVCLFVQNSDFDQSLIPAVEQVTSNYLVIDSNVLGRIYEQRARDNFDLYKLIRENLRAKEVFSPNQLSNIQQNQSFVGSQGASVDILMDILKKSPGFGEEVPKAWMDLKDILHKESQTLNTIDKAYYLQLCEQHNITGPSAALDFLHKTGSVKHINLLIIDPVIILNIKWLISQSIKLLTNGNYQLAASDFQLKDPFIIIQVLRSLGIVIQTENGIILIPDLFPETTEATLQISQTAYPSRVFQYEQPIQNIHYQIFAHYFTSLKPDSLSQNGAVITRGKAQVAVIIDKKARTISLFIDGPGSGALRQEIEAKIEETNSVEHLTAVKHIPCVCSQCLSDKKPTLFAYPQLIDYQSKGETYVQCTKSRALVPIQDLLALEPAKIRIQTLIETYTKISNADEKRMLELLEEKDDSARIAWLEKGLVAYKAVGQVIGNNSSIGTGFLLADKTVLTCNHVVKKEDLERDATIKFTALEQPDQIFTYNLALEGFECSPSEALNFSRMRVDDHEVKLLSSWGHLPGFNIDAVKIGAPVFMIRYHQGKIKEIDFKPSVVIDASTDFIYYTFHENSPGSSGGPIFNENWDCIGMHEAAGERLDIGTSGQKGPARKGVSIKAILKPTTNDQLPETEPSPIMAEIEFIKDLAAQLEIESAIKALQNLDKEYNIGINSEIGILSSTYMSSQRYNDQRLLGNESNKVIRSQNAQRILALLNEIPQKLEQNQEAQKQSTDIRRKIKK